MLGQSLMLSVVMLSVFMVNVAAPTLYLAKDLCNWAKSKQQVSTVLDWNESEKGTIAYMKVFPSTKLSISDDSPKFFSTKISFTSYM
jgi:hypothetical protein